MNSIEQMIQRWRDEKVLLNDGAPMMQVESLERLIGVQLPEDLRTFYAAANGMADYQHDPRMVSMWSVERIVRERNIHEGEDEWGPFQDIAIADVLFSAWYLRLRAREAGGMVLLAELTHEEFPSLYAVFDAFLQRPGSMGLAALTTPGTK
ncbi:MAG: SMI1/KNR4 family protein [Betaproteobacteria bacterium]